MDDKRQRRLSDDAKRRIRYTVVTVVFLATAVVHCSVLLPMLRWILEWVIDEKTHWDHAPFLQTLFTLGGLVFFGTIVSTAVNDMMHQRVLLDRLQWRKLFVVIFCCVLGGTLNEETKELAPRSAMQQSHYRYSEHIDEDDYDPGPSPPFPLIVFAIVAAVGYATWPKDRTWRCSLCKNVNPYTTWTCLNPDCREDRKVQVDLT